MTTRLTGSKGRSQGGAATPPHREREEQPASAATAIGNARLDYKGAVEFLHTQYGMTDVTDRTLRKAVARGQLTASVRGSIVRFQPAWLSRWAERNTRVAFADMKEK